MSIFRRKTVKKVSVDFSAYGYYSLSKYAEETESTMGRIVNYMVETFIDIPPSVKKELSEYCAVKTNELCTMIPHLSEFERSEIDTQLRAYQNLHFYLQSEYHIPRFPNQNKKRASVDFDITNYNAVVDFTKKAETTFGRAINYLSYLVLEIPQNVKDDLAAFCSFQMQQINMGIVKLSEYERAEAERVIKSYMRVVFFWTQGTGPKTAQTPGMRKIYLKDGHVLFPSDWIVLNNALEQPENSTRALCVEVRNWERYGIPHFLVFTNKVAEELTEEEKSRVFDACTQAFPKFRDVLKDMVMPPSSTPMFDPEYKAAARRHLDSPYPGIFTIVATDDMWYRETETPPFGCIIVRNRKEQV